MRKSKGNHLPNRLFFLLFLSVGVIFYSTYYIPIKLLEGDYFPLIAIVILFTNAMMAMSEIVHPSNKK